MPSKVAGKPQPNTTSKSTPPQTAIRVNFGSLAHVPAQSIAWQFKRTDHLHERLITCAVPAHEDTPVKRPSRGFVQLSDTAIVIYTRLLTTVHQTIASHIELMQCLKHMSNEALDLVTRRRFTAKNWPQPNDDKRYPLDMFISLRKTETSVHTVGLRRLGKADLHFKNMPENAPIWQMVGLMLAAPNLDEALRLERLNFIVTKQTASLVIVEPKPDRIDKKNTPTNPIGKRVQRVRRSPVPKTLPQPPKKLPEYR